MTKQEIMKPKRLERGSTVGIVSPGSPLANLVPRRFNRALEAIRQLGFEVKEGKGARGISGYVSASAEARANDINTFFRDPEVSAIFCSIGGLHYNQLLKYLDFEAAASNPKVFLGFSDATVIQLALWKMCKLVTFSGPACLTQFAETPELNSYTKEFLLRAVCSDGGIGEVRASSSWTDEVLDWFTGEDESRGRAYRPNPGWSWLTSGSASGPILGGCIPSMLHLAGTKYWPDLTGAIVLLETPEGSDFKRGLEIPYVDMYLTNLENLGVFDDAAGVVVGRPFGYTAEEVLQFNSLVESYLGNKNYPVLMGVDYGHTDPLLTIPIGVNTYLDSSTGRFEIRESGTVKSGASS